MKYTILGGSAGEALTIVVSSLNDINGLLEEEGALTSAPDILKDKTKSIVKELKVLVDMLNKEVGDNKDDVQKTEEGKTTSGPEDKKA